MIFRAALGIALALTVLYGQGWVAPQAVLAAKADIAATGPEARLRILGEQAVATLVARFGTARAEIVPPRRARVLQP
jgi:hypothetical protein